MLKKSALIFVALRAGRRFNMSLFPFGREQFAGRSRKHGKAGELRRDCSVFQRQQQAQAPQ